MNAHIGVDLHSGLVHMVVGTSANVADVMQARVEHPFRVIKRQSGYAMVRYRRLAKNTAQLRTLFMLGNLWMARRHVLAAKGAVCPQWAKNPGNGAKMPRWRPS